MSAEGLQLVPEVGGAGGVFAAPGGQDEVAYPVLGDEVPGEGLTQLAGAAGEDGCPILIHGPWGNQHHLAHVTGVGHEAKGALGVAQVIGHQGERLEGALLKEGH